MWIGHVGVGLEPHRNSPLEEENAKREGFGRKKNGDVEGADEEVKL